MTTAAAMDDLRTKIISKYLIGGSPTKPTSITVGLTSDTPNHASAGTAITDSGYSAQTIYLKAQSTPGQTSNSGTVAFGTCVTAAVCVGFVLKDNNSNNSIAATLTTPRTFAPGDAMNFADGTLAVNLDTGALCDDLRTDAVEFFLRCNTVSSPVAWTIRADTSAPTHATSGTECTGSGYVAQSIVFVSGTNAGECKNSGIVSFTDGSHTADWGTITHYEVKYGTKRALQGALTTPEHVDVGNAHTIADAALTLAFT